MSCLAPVLFAAGLTLAGQGPPAQRSRPEPPAERTESAAPSPKASAPSARGAGGAAAAPLPEHAVRQLSQLVGQPAVLHPTKGERLEDVELLSFAPGRIEGTFKSVTVRSGESGRKRTLRAAALGRMEIGGQPYEVAFAAALRGHVLIDLTQRDAQIDARLRAQRQRLWPELSAEEQAQAVRERKEFFARAGEAFGLRLHETQYFLFYTDLPDEALAPYIRDLDAMYARLVAAFGLPQGKNIWRGKAAIVMFQNQASCWQFDQQVLKKPSSADFQARCHWSSDGHVTISGWSGTDPAFFAHILVHETAHGFLARYRSTVNVPSWINEGIADWVAGAVVPASNTTRRRQELAIKQLRQTGAAGGTFFTAPNVPRVQYGLASALVEYLLRIDAAAYRRFIDGIKEGATPDESLQAAYGMTKEQLLVAFGRQIGVPNLLP
jgi:hypothetical protein